MNRKSNLVRIIWGLGVIALLAAMATACARRINIPN